MMKQELVQTEGNSFVAEAQLTNVTPAKPTHSSLPPIVERGEQAILAKHLRRMLNLNLFDDTPTHPQPRRP
jgi:hypothetical protein